MTGAPDEGRLRGLVGYALKRAAMVAEAEAVAAPPPSSPLSSLVRLVTARSASARNSISSPVETLRTR